jgi:hypothetical protein
VEVEVVLAEVREDERVEAHPVEPVQLRCVRGRLERDAAVAGVEHLPEGALQVDRLGCRAHDAAGLAADARLDRAEQPRSPARGGEHGVEQERGRRLAVRPGHARDLELARRLPEERVGCNGHCRPGVRDDQLRHGDVQLPLDHQRGGAGGDRLRRELVPVRALARVAEEQRAVADGASVVGKVDDLDRPSAHDLARRERRDERVQLHRARSP